MKKETLEIIGLIVAIVAPIVSAIVTLVIISYKKGKRDEKFESLPCVSHTTKLEEIQETLYTIKGIIIGITPERLEFFSFKNSPRKLNQYGLKIFEDFGGNSFIDKNKSFLFEQINLKSPKTEFDVENISSEILLENVDKDIFIGIKKILYNYPEIELTGKDGKIEKMSITITDLCFIIGIVLRDVYLKEHPEIIESDSK